MFLKLINWKVGMLFDAPPPPPRRFFSLLWVIRDRERRNILVHECSPSQSFVYFCNCNTNVCFVVWMDVVTPYWQFCTYVIEARAFREQCSSE